MKYLILISTALTFTIANSQTSTLLNNIWKESDGNFLWFDKGAHIAYRYNHIVPLNYQATDSTIVFYRDFKDDFNNTLPLTYEIKADTLSLKHNGLLMDDGILVKANSLDFDFEITFDSIRIFTHCSKLSEMRIYADSSIVFYLNHPNKYRALGFNKGKIEEEQWIEFERKLKIVALKDGSVWGYERRSCSDCCIENKSIIIYDNDAEVSYTVNSNGKRINSFIEYCYEQLLPNIKYYPCTRTGKKDNVRRVYVPSVGERNIPLVGECVAELTDWESGIDYYLFKQDSTYSFLISNHFIPVNRKIGVFPKSNNNQDKNMEHLTNMYGMSYSVVDKVYDLSGAVYYDYPTLISQDRLEKIPSRKTSVSLKEWIHRKFWEKSDFGKRLVKLLDENGIKPTHNKGYD